MFDLEEMALSSKVVLNATDVTIQDARTGKITKHTFYRSGKRFPFEVIGKELANYGYRLMSVSDPVVVEGTMNWNELFGAFLQQEQK